MSKPVFLVAGGSRGIGAAIARGAAAAGYPVVLSYAGHAERAAGVVEEIRATGGRAAAVQADTGTREGVDRLFEAADRHGPLGVLAYNAGITGGAARLCETDPDTIARVLDVNLLGAILCARAAGLRMGIGHGGAGGAIVFVSSRAAVFGAPGMHVWYAASKGGIDSLTIGLARELGPEGIRVNAVAPGPIGTEMLTSGQVEAAATVTALGRVGRPEEVASAVLYLASDAASYVTGANLAVSGGR